MLIQLPAQVPQTKLCWSRPALRKNSRAVASQMESTQFTSLISPGNALKEREHQGVDERVGGLFLSELNCSRQKFY